MCDCRRGVKDEKIEDEIFNTFTVHRVVHESFYACAHVIFSKTFISHDGLWQRLSVGADVKLLRTFEEWRVRRTETTHRRLCFRYEV